MTWLDSLEAIRKTDWTKVTAAERDAQAREVINICAYGGALTALVPLPLADVALLLPVHSLMVMTIGHVFGRSITQTEAKRIALELGAVAGLSFAGLSAISALKKVLLPGIGGLLSAPATFALTWGLGRASISYFQEPALSREDLRKVFDDALKEGKAAFSKDAFDRFRSKNQDAPPPPSASAGEEPASEPVKPAEKPAAQPANATNDSFKRKKRTL